MIEAGPSASYRGYGAQIIIGGVLIDSGTIDLGGLWYGGDGSADASLLVEQGGTVDVQGGKIYSEGTINNAGLFVLSDGTMTEVSLFSNTGTMQVENGSGMVIEGGSATIENAGTLQIADGNIGGAGRVNNSGLITGTGILTSEFFENNGTVSVSNGRLVIKPVFGITGEGQFTVGAEGTLTMTGNIASGETVALGGADSRLQVTAEAAGVFVVSPSGGRMDVFGGGTAVLNPADSSLVVHLADATNLTLSQMTFVGGIGSSGNDQITALAQDQFLTGGLGTDTLTGSGATGDLFRDTAAGLNGDTIVNFAGTDAIDITDIAPGQGLALGYEQNGASGTLSVSNGASSTSINMAGTFASGMFSTTGGGQSGVLIHLTG